MIEFKNIEIKYGNFVAIENLNLEIKKGEFFTFLGPSGCGKTTTLRALVGFNPPSKGNILVSGKDITHMPVEKRKIGIVFQSYALFPTMSIYENIAYGLKVQKLKPDIIKKKVLDVAKIIAIDESHLDKNISELSGGQQQRVALARAIVLEPEILCLDEPLSNLDAKLRVDLRIELKRLQKELGITTLYVTHDQEEALTLSDRIAVFNKGFIEQVGTPSEIYKHSNTEFVCNFIGESNKLGKKVLSELNSKFGSTFDVDKKGFIRTESLHLHENKPHTACLQGKIVDSSLVGSFMMYTIEVLGEQIRFIEKNDDQIHLEEGKTENIFFNLSDIKQY